jgi:hypothetical protein
LLNTGEMSSQEEISNEEKVETNVEILSQILEDNQFSTVQLQEIVIKYNKILDDIKNSLKGNSNLTISTIKNKV